MNLLFIAIGGAVGSVARYTVSSAVTRLTAVSFPVGTFVVNVIGCIAFGILAGAAEHRVALTPEARVFLFTGLLGGFTTFSAYTFESFVLLGDGRPGLALLNIVGQIVAGVSGLWIGLALTR